VEFAPGRTGHEGAFGRPDDVVVIHDPRVGVELAAGDQGHQIAAPLGVEQEYPLTRDKGRYPRRRLIHSASALTFSRWPEGSDKLTR
jgi:hypothetical protein